MYSTLEKLKPELKQAVNLIRAGARPTFRVKVCNDFKEFEQIKAGTMSSCRIGEMKGRSFELGTKYADTLVKKAMQKRQWPETVKYANGVLFIESVAVIEPEKREAVINEPVIEKPKKIKAKDLVFEPIEEPIIELNEDND